MLEPSLIVPRCGTWFASDVILLSNINVEASFGTSFPSIIKHSLQMLEEFGRDIHDKVITVDVGIIHDGNTTHHRAHWDKFAARPWLRANTVQAQMPVFECLCTNQSIQW